MVDRIKSVGEIEVGEAKHIVLEIVDGKYKGCQYIYGEIKFGDKENADGTMGMSFDYEITNGFIIDDKADFINYLGDTLMMIIDEQVKNREVIYKGGV